MALVALPNYLAQHGSPKNIDDLQQHRLIGIKLSAMSVADALNSGHLVELLPEYAITYEPFYLYYPSRRGHSNVFKLIVDALKVKAV